MAVAVIMMIRLDKYLADMGAGTRNEIKKAVRAGKVYVNGTVTKRPETKINTEQDTVELNGLKVAYTDFEYFMLNKPAGTVSAVTDRRDTTVVQLIKERKRDDLFPVGRLDRDTEGLLLITNDGALAHRLLSPAKHVDKVYYARIRGTVTEEDKKRFAEGLDIGDDRLTLPADLEICSSGAVSEIKLTIHEGRFHQVKRMFQAVGKEVLFLKRIKMGPLMLDERLTSGEYRRLTEEEVNELCSMEKKQ